MPYYNMRELWTPLRFIGIRFYKNEEGDWFLKVGNRKRKKIS